MQKSLIRCVRCDGRKKVFKINNGYTLVSMGAPEVVCPLCMGDGMMPNHISTIIEKLPEDEVKSVNTEKESKDAKKDRKDKDKD